MRHNDVPMRILLRYALLLGASSMPFVAAELPTGPAAGETIPAFEAVDQTGAQRTFENLAGPKGLLLLFHRSADW